MADYIYLLENRLSPAQRNALRIARDVARAQGLTIFLVGGAVRDLTSGSPVRDLDVAVQGNALKSKKEFEKAGAVITGENDAMQTLYLRLPGHVRMEFGSTLTVTFPKPGKPSVKPGTILEDLRRRDFTANAMAISLNDGSYGLLMDPLNGTADIENRHLRLVSNYGFIEDPVRMVRAARLMARLGWFMDDKTQLRYETGKQEGYLSTLSEFHRGYELEEIVHEEDPLRVMRGLEAEGWMKQLSPFWTSAKANMAEVERLREAQTQLEMQNLHPDNGAANFPLLTAKLSAQEVATLKASFPRQGFVREIEALDGEAKQFAAQLSAKTAALPSQAWKLITSASPEAVLWVAYSNKGAGIQGKLKAFATEWPQARQKMPYTQMQEMRITSDLPGYEDLLEKLFFELMDGKLQTPEEMKAFLEPYSPPAPPPPVNLRRMRAAKKEPKPRASKAKVKAPEEVAGADQGAAQADTATAATEPGAKPAASPVKDPAKARPATAQKAATVATTPPASTHVKSAAATIAPPAAKKAAAVKPAKAPARESAAPPKTPAGKAVGAKKAAAPAAKKSAPVSAKKSVSRAVPEKKATAKKVPSRKPLHSKVSAKKHVAVKTAAKKNVASKAPATKAVTPRSPAKKMAAKAAAVKGSKARSAAKNTPATAKKTFAPAKKSTPAKKITPAKKAAAKQVVRTKPGAKKTAAKAGRRR